MNKDKIVTLLNQIIKKAKENDKKHKLKMFSEHSCQGAIGDSWMVFHLQELKKLIEN